MTAARTAAQKETIARFLDAWNRLAVDDFGPLRTPDCTQAMLPAASLGGQPLNNQEADALLKPMFGVLSNFKADVVHQMHDGDAATAVLHVRTTADSAIGPYTNEHVMFFTFTDDGKKLTKLQDFMDSAFVRDYQPRFKAYISKQAQS